MLGLDKLQPSVEDWLRKARVEGTWAPNSTIDARGKIVEPRMTGEGLKPSAITRDRTWGVPVSESAKDKALGSKVFCESEYPLELTQADAP
jgi:methionyl-tRNA synthetase